MKILVTEDESDVMKLLRNTLKQYSLIEAVNAEEALHRFIGHNYRIDLLIADMTLPDISGVQVALLLRARLPRLPVILTSGSAVSDWRPRDKADLGRLDRTSVVVLQKPFPPEALRNAVSELIGTAWSGSASGT